MKAARHYHVPDLVVAVILLVLAVAVTVTAYGYGQASGVFPRFIGWIFTALTLAEVSIQIRGLWAGRGAVAATDAAPPGPVARECRGVLWLCGFLAGIYLLGFIIAIILYMFVFLRLSAARPVKECMLITGGAALFVYLVFVRLLEYKLYAGILIGS